MRYAPWQRDPAAFWDKAARTIDWYETPTRNFDSETGPWFADGVCNACYNALDRHIRAGRNNQIALIYDSPATTTIKTFTYGRVLSEVQLLGAILRDFGVTKGDRIIIYMPMVPEAAFAMLACARIGAIHSVVPSGLSAEEFARRIDQVKPHLILSASCGIEGARIIPYKPLLDKAVALAQHKPKACLILQRPQCEAALSGGRDYDWRKVWEHAVEYAKTSECTPLAATDPLCIVSPSRTSSTLKEIMRDNGSYLAALAWFMQNLYHLAPGEVWWCTYDIGSMEGQSYIVYAPLIHGATSIIYEGDLAETADSCAFSRVIAQYKAAAVLTTPGILHAISRQDPDAKCFAPYDLSSLRVLFLAGERVEFPEGECADPAMRAWAEEKFKVPVRDAWGCL